MVQYREQLMLVTSQFRQAGQVSWIEAQLMSTVDCIQCIPSYCWSARCVDYFVADLTRMSINDLLTSPGCGLISYWPAHGRKVSNWSIHICCWHTGCSPACGCGLTNCWAASGCGLRSCWHICDRGLRSCWHTCDCGMKTCWRARGCGLHSCWYVCGCGLLSCW